MSVEKNKEYIVDIIDTGFQGEGIAKIDNFTIFIPNAIKGEKIKILVVKVLSSHAFGKIIEILKKSEFRKESDCNTYKRCGGCNLRHVDYDETLKMKQNSVQSLVNKTLKSKVKVEKTLGMESPYHYRNKAQYPLGINREGKPVIGVFANRTHEIIPIKKCFIQNEQTEQIAKSILEFITNNNISIYNEKTRKGLVRHIVTRIGIKTNEIMCVLVINGDKIGSKEIEDKLVKNIIEKFPNIKTIVKNINKKNTNVIMGKENINLYGDGYITDKIKDYTFKISPLSFYQVNPLQTERLYSLAVEKANISKDDIVFDLYCGIGTISIFIAEYAKKVYGIEIVEEAIEAAEENTKLNSIDNIEFIAGDVENELDKLLNEKVIPNVIILDPPRKGLDNTSIKNILTTNAKKIVYISCNPATLVRDLSLLEEKYCINSITPVDMFPFTSHVECVAVLTLKENK